MQNLKFIQDVEKIKCPLHQQEISLFSMEGDQNLEERLLCEACLQSVETWPRALIWKVVKEKIRPQHILLQQQQHEEKEWIKQQIRAFQNIMERINTQLYQNLGEIVSNLELWRQNIEDIEKEGLKINSQSLLEELEKIVGLQNESQENKIKFWNSGNVRQCNFNFTRKLKTSICKLLSFDSCIFELDEVLGNIFQGFRQKDLDPSEIDENSQQIHQQLLAQLQELKKYFDAAINYLNSGTLNKNNLSQSLHHTSEALQPIKYQLIDQVKQKEYCGAVAFNNEGTLMAAVSGENIKLWQIEKGKLKSTTHILSGHVHNINCLIFSKRMNWIASAGQDGAVHCWKLKTDNVWMSFKSGHTHIAAVQCILLNNSEDLLFSCSKDNSIKVWKADTCQNQLEYQYSLEKHLSCVNCISLNTSETSLVSCSDDKSIIIWGKGWWYRKWQFKYFIKKNVDDFGQRLCFVNNNLIAWQQYSNGKTHIFELEKGIYQEKPELQIDLQSFGDDIGSLFPLIYNSKRKILIIKQNQFICIISHSEQNKFIKQAAFIKCNSFFNYGSLTNSGEYLAIWDNGVKQLRLYRISQ